MNNPSSRIFFLIPYFGRWPFWMPFFLESCRRSEFTEAFSTPGGHIKWHDGTDDFPLRWYWREGCLTNDRDGDRSFPYFHFYCWKRNEWSRMAEPDPEYVKDLAAKPAWIIDATGFIGDES
ncbi:hypothetical protein HK44_026140 [Pseudomonas fluorescens HK44]|uniref:Uncharacterized protein n=1 Tax=Pseudomonas fluorescens HK44 TaxID=1042209 RepID=A0A010SRB2_PSEFL|nr:hypothetical protein HK44_026140 [Pseudomonas fluorescens HK44]